MQSDQPPPWLVALVLALAAYVVVTQCVASWPLDVHLWDDAFYYFEWARNLAAGNGPCVTPDVPTSGLHVLWGLLLAGVVLVGGSAVLPEASVFLGLALHLATASLIYRAASPQRRLGLCAASVYAGSPFLAAQALTGPGTGLACFAMAVLCLTYRSNGAGTGSRSPNRAFFWAGLFAVAARSDLIFFVAALALVEARRRFSRVILTFGILGCYATWNLLLAGQWIQDSAAPIPWLMDDEFQNSGRAFSERFWLYAKPILLGVPFRLSSTVMALAWLIVAWVGWRRREPGFAWLLVGGVALVVFHNLWRYYPRDYYFAPLGVVGGLAVVRCWQVAPRTGIVIVALGLLWNGRHAWDVPVVRPAQREMALAGSLLWTFVPSGEPVGCFNSGLVSWLHDGAVVNLDGVVNAPAFEALQRGDLLDYLRRKRVHYLVDNPIQFARSGVHSCGQHFGPDFDAAHDLEEIVRFQWLVDRRSPSDSRGREGIGWFSLYRLRDQGEPPLAHARIEDLGGDVIQWVAKRGQRLHDGESTIYTAPADLTYVLQVPRGDPPVEPMRIYVDDAAEPILVLPVR